MNIDCFIKWAEGGWEQFGSTNEITIGKPEAIDLPVTDPRALPPEFLGVMVTHDFRIVVGNLIIEFPAFFSGWEPSNIHLRMRVVRMSEMTFRIREEE